ncbi:MAG: MotA/TolQ/ExbB proton channel family protein [Wenzhouxiangella sp.]
MEPVSPTLAFTAAALPGTSVVGYFLQSNMAGQVIVLILIALSLVAWTIMLGKYRDLQKLAADNGEYEALLSKQRQILDLDPDLPDESPYSALVQSALESFYHYGADLNDPDTHRAALRMGHVENALQRGVARQTMHYESKMVLLGSIVTGAPFLGLLGTVWGVMDAFGAMAGTGSASLQALAPGVSGALLTTVAGLLVAIPAAFGYNYLLQQSRTAIVELENFASVIADRIEMEAQAAAAGFL